MNNQKLELIKDPAQVQDFLSDKDDNVYFNDNSEDAICCDHCHRQMKHKEGWLYCVNSCDIEGNA